MIEHMVRKPFDAIFSAEKAEPVKYNHSEAFKSMIYQCEHVNSHVERIWNSRDGVTPFSILPCSMCSPSQDRHSAMNHSFFGSDFLFRFYVPSVGERIFVDLTEERAHERAVRKVDTLWDVHLKHRYDDKQRAVMEFIKDHLRPGAPDLITVTEEGRQIIWDSHKQVTDCPSIVFGPVWSKSITFSGGRFA